MTDPSPDARLRRLLAEHEEKVRSILGKAVSPMPARPSDPVGDPRENGGRSILVISPDLPPSTGHPTSGAGLRAWGLAEGLRSRGHEVTLAVPDTTADAIEWKGDRGAVIFPGHDLDRFVRDRGPDVVVFQHWLLAGELRGDYRHTVIDLHGPLLLETLFRQGAEVAELFDRKVEAFSRAHFFTCAGERQKQYFFAWLLLAGFDLRRAPIEVVRFSLPPEPPVHEYPCEPEFVFGGHFLPWQNPALGLEVLVQELESGDQGHLWLFGSYHSWVETGSLPAFERVRRLLGSSGRATVSPALNRADLIERYRKMSVAWDLMPYNCERGMAFTSRTAEYLWAGLPVVHQRYAELSELISTYEAGWLVDPDDPEAIRRVVRRILSNPEEIRLRGRNAQALARDWLDWSRTVDPLDAFVRDPDHKRGRRFDERNEV